MRSLLRRSIARLAIAKLDRLSRNVAFIATPLEKKVDFIAVDNPHATKFNLHILAAVAEFERDAISRRTTEALAAAKARGVKLGNYARIARAKQAATRARAGERASAIEATAPHVGHRRRPIFTLCWRRRCPIACCRALSIPRMLPG
jgi:DNA invertase Pin-like site-specific DNA recombinase